MFGFDLFGRPPIQLPDDNADDALLFRRHGHRSGTDSTPTTTLTTQTFDSDVAPLYPASKKSPSPKPLKQPRRRQSVTKKGGEEAAEEGDEEARGGWCGWRWRGV